MEIERGNNEILIRLSADTDTIGLQRMIDSLRFKESTAKSTAKDDEINNLAEESKGEWWSKNKSKFIK